MSGQTYAEMIDQPAAQSGDLAGALYPVLIPSTTGGAATTALASYALMSTSISSLFTGSITSAPVATTLSMSDAVGITTLGAEHQITVTNFLEAAGITGSLASLTTAIAAETTRAEAAEAALTASSAGSITAAPSATTMATSDTVGISTEGAEHQITLANLLAAGGVTGSLASLTTAIAAETTRAEGAEAALAASSAGSITAAPTVTTMATSDTVGISTEGAEHQITLANLLTAGGTAVTGLSAAAVAAAGDEFLAIQSGAAVLQTNSGLWSYVAAQVPGLRQPVVLLTGNTVLDGSVHNGAILICEAALTISPAASFSSLSSGFYCTVVNVSGAAVTFGTGITTSGGTTLSNGSAANITAFTYTGGNVVFANMGGGSTPTSPGLSVGVSSSSVATGSTIGVIGQVYPGSTAVQVALGTSDTGPPSSGFVSTTVSGTSFTATLTPSSPGTYYVWAQETATPAVAAVSGAVTVATYTVAFTSPPTTATTGSALSLAGTVTPAGQATRVALGSSNSAVPTSGFVSATVSGTSWTASLTPGTVGTFYLWVQQTADPSVVATSAAVIVSAPPNTISITSAPATATTGVAMSGAGTVGPTGTAVQVALGSSATVAPTTGFTAATVSGTGWTASITPTTAGTFYLWAEVTTDITVSAVSAAIVVSAPPAYMVIQSQSGGTTWSEPEQDIASTQSISGDSGDSLALTMPITPAQVSGATVTGYWTPTAPTTQPTTGQITAGVPPLFYSTNVATYLPPPASTGVWYLSMWIENNGSDDSFVVMTPITWTS